MNFCHIIRESLFYCTCSSSTCLLPILEEGEKVLYRLKMRPFFVVVEVNGLIKTIKGSLVTLFCMTCYNFSFFFLHDSCSVNEFLRSVTNLRHLLYMN